MRNKRTIDFVGKFKFFVIIPLAVILVGVIMNIVSGVSLDINFSGGTKLSYSYTGDVDTKAAEKAIKGSLSKYDVSVSQNQNYTTNTSSLVVSVLGNKGLISEEIEKIDSALKTEFKDNDIKSLEKQSVDPTIGTSFFAKSMYALVLACVLVGVYVGFRFRKIGGVSAALTAIVALIHDAAIAYVAYVIFGFTIGDNFIAVMLTILGYSLNDTIVIYDRVRENEVLYNDQKSVRELVNLSITQSVRRTLITSITTFAAISCVTVVAAIAGLDSILSFSIPMSVGVVAGSFSSICIAGPLYVIWKEHREKKAKNGKKASGKVPAYVNRMK